LDNSKALFTKGYGRCFRWGTSASTLSIQSSQGLLLHGVGVELAAEAWTLWRAAKLWNTYLDCKGFQRLCYTGLHWKISFSCPSFGAFCRKGLQFSVTKRKDTLTSERLRRVPVCVSCLLLSGSTKLPTQQEETWNCPGKALWLLSVISQRQVPSQAPL